MTDKPASPRILVVDDDQAIRSLLVAALRREALDVDAARDGAEALELVRVQDYAVILLDIMMPRVNGLDFLIALDALQPKRRSVIIVISAFDERRLASIDSSQVHAFVRKPFDLGQTVEVVREVAASWRDEAATCAPGDGSFTAGDYKPDLAN